MTDEFLYRWPGAKHLMSLMELEQRMDKILADRIASDIEAVKKKVTDTAELEQKMDKIIAEDYDKVNRAMTNTMVEVFDTRILRRHSTETATLGKMSASSIVQKFQ
jgi:hypothetical protein